MEGVPRRNQIRVLLKQLVFEPTKGSPASDGPPQPTPSSVITDPLGEVSHVRVPNRRGERVDRHQIQFIEIDRVLPVDPGVRRPERDLAGPRIDQPSVFVVGLIRKRRRISSTSSLPRSSISSA
jgi:hypothetical protein